MEQLFEMKVGAGEWITGIGLGFLAWFIVRYLIAGLYTVNQDQRAVLTSFGRAQRISAATSIHTSDREFGLLGKVPDGRAVADGEEAIRLLQTH